MPNFVQGALQNALSIQSNPDQTMSNARQAFADSGTLALKLTSLLDAEEKQREDNMRAIELNVIRDRTQLETVRNNDMTNKDRDAARGQRLDINNANLIDSFENRKQRADVAKRRDERLDRQNDTSRIKTALSVNQEINREAWEEDGTGGITKVKPNINNPELLSLYGQLTYGLSTKERAPTSGGVATPVLPVDTQQQTSILDIPGVTQEGIQNAQANYNVEPQLEIDPAKKKEYRLELETLGKKYRDEKAFMEKEGLNGPGFIEKVEQKYKLELDGIKKRIASEKGTQPTILPTEEAPTVSSGLTPTIENPQQNESLYNKHAAETGGRLVDYEVVGGKPQVRKATEKQKQYQQAVESIAGKPLSPMASEKFIKEYAKNNPIKILDHLEYLPKVEASRYAKQSVKQLLFSQDFKNNAAKINAVNKLVNDGYITSGQVDAISRDTGDKIYKNWTGPENAVIAGQIPLAMKLRNGKIDGETKALNETIDTTIANANMEELSQFASNSSSAGELTGFAASDFNPATLKEKILNEYKQNGVSSTLEVIKHVDSLTKSNVFTTAGLKTSIVDVVEQAGLLKGVDVSKIKEELKKQKGYDKTIRDYHSQPHTEVYGSIQKTKEEEDKYKKAIKDRGNRTRGSAIFKALGKDKKLDSSLRDLSARAVDASSAGKPTFQYNGNTVNTNDALGLAMVSESRQLRTMQAQGGVEGIFHALSKASAFEFGSNKKTSDEYKTLTEGL